MVYFPFEFRFPGTNRHIKNGSTKLRLNYSLATGLSDSRVRKIHHEMNMEVATAQMKEPDPKPAPAKGKFSFGVHVPGGLGIQGKTVILLINYLLSYVICNNMDLPS